MKKKLCVICCYCGNQHVHHSIDQPIITCAACGESLSDETGWIAHAVRIFIEDADPEIVGAFIAEIKSRRRRLRPKKRGVKGGRTHTGRKVA